MVTVAKGQVIGAFAAAEKIGFALLHTEGLGLAACPFMTAVAKEAVTAAAAHTIIVGLSRLEFDPLRFVEENDGIFTHVNSFDGVF